MTTHLRLIVRQLGHLQRMRKHLAHSVGRAQKILPMTNWQAMSLEQIFAAATQLEAIVQRVLAKLQTMQLPVTL